MILLCSTRKHYGGGAYKIIGGFSKINKNKIAE